MSFLDLFKSKKNREETNVLPDTLQRSFGFPETDESGKKALVLREADIYGVGRTYSKIAAQDVISKMNIGDPVLLKRSETSDAVKSVFFSRRAVWFLAGVERHKRSKSQI